MDMEDTIPEHIFPNVRIMNGKMPETKRIFLFTENWTG